MPSSMRCAKTDVVTELRTEAKRLGAMSPNLDRLLDRVDAVQRDRLEDAFDEAVGALGSPASAREWLAKPNSGIDGARPLELVIAGRLGYDKVIAAIANLKDLRTRIDVSEYFSHPQSPSDRQSRSTSDLDGLEFVSFMYNKLLGFGFHSKRERAPR